MKKIVIALLTVLLMLSNTQVAFAEDEETVSQEQTLVLEDLDPESLHVEKIGERLDEDEPAEMEEHRLDEMVRVSIVLDEPSVIDAGYSAESFLQDDAAMNYREQLRQNQSRMIEAIDQVLDEPLNVKWNLTFTVNIISAETRYGDMVKIRSVDGVKDVFPENRYEAQEDDVNTANTSVYMTGSTSVWADGYSGAGQRIAIIDTGIDTDHQSFDASAFDYSIGRLSETPELMSRISSTVKNQLNSKSDNYVSTKIPYAYNYVDNNTTVNHLSDTEGEHGSHVAGIAAANRYIKSGNSYVDAAESVKAVGMAPDAQLLVMKVFGSSGGAYDSDYMAAIEDAIILGADAVNLSLGSSVQGFTYDGTYQSVLNKLSSADNPNMVVTISAGNAGALSDDLDTELYIDDVSMHTGGSPGTFINSLCVAAAENTGSTGSPLTVEGNNIFYTETSSSGTAMTSIAGNYSYVYIDAPGNTSDYSTVNSAVSLSGKIVIVNRGDISFYEKGNNAINYSPKALIVANNAKGSISMSLDDYTGSFPMISITLADANLIKENSAVHSSNGITYYTGTMSVSNTITSGNSISREDAEVTDFSSWGVPGSLLMKPEITAPGGNIYSVFGQNKTSNGTTGGSDQYELMSGTSMAAPHMAGLSAIVAQYIKDQGVEISGFSRRALIQSLLMSTATPMINNGHFVSILQQGAGLADVSKAVHSSSVVMIKDGVLTTATGAAADGKVKVELGDDKNREGVYAYSFELYNLSDRELEFELNTKMFTQGSYEEDGSVFMDRNTIDLLSQASYTWVTSSSDSTYDVNLDDITDRKDAQAILDKLTGVINETDANDADKYDWSKADVDENGNVSSHDAELLLQYTGSINQGYVLPANGKATVYVTISLDEDQKNELNDLYPSGAYIEGFTSVKCISESSEGVSYEHEHSIPILGFYGNWTDPSMFDNTSYTDTFFNTEKIPYTGKTETNYLTLTYNGVSSMFTGNPYMAEESFPENRLAINSGSQIGKICYSLLRAAGTTGYAVSRIDERGGNVTSVLSSAVTGNEVSGIWYYASQGSWQNTGSKTYSINKTPTSYGLKEGDCFRIGYYAIPEYNAMITKDSMTSSDSGILSSSGFKDVILSNVLGKGAFIGYDFIIDDTDPVISSASLNGNELSISVSDETDLAYLAVLSLDGNVKYAQKAPGQKEYSISVDISDAIANAKGYIAVFAADYAGNETAKAIKVNDESSEEKTIYVLSDTLDSEGEYLIVNTASAGSAYALGHNGSSAAADALSIHAGNSDTGNAVYIESDDVESTSVWTVSGSNTFTFKNGNYYLRRNSSTLQISTSTSSTAWTWNASAHRLYQSASNRSYYLVYNNGFRLNTSASSVYLYKKATIMKTVDPDQVESVSISQSSLDLYKGDSIELAAEVSPLTASDRSVSWSSSDTSVATVDENGRVSAIGAGTAVIAAHANANNSIYGECAVNVVSVSKLLNGIVWNEEGKVYFANFNAGDLPNYSTLNSDDLGKELSSALMYNSSTLYAGTFDSSAGETVIYSVNRNNYSLSEYGNNYVPALDMAIGASGSTYQSYISFVYIYGPYVISGPIAPGDDGEGGTYSGLPYALLNCEETTGGAYLAGVACKSRSSSGGTYYLLDENGVIYQTTLSYNNSDGFIFSTPSVVMETGIGTSFMYQNLYYDGTYLYWAHTADNIAELIIIDPSAKKIYHAGNFGEGVWPFTGLYVNGSVAPASVEDETQDLDIPAQSIRMDRDELMSDAIKARYENEASKHVLASVIEEATEVSVYGEADKETAEETDEMITDPEIIAEDETTVLEETDDEATGSLNSVVTERTHKALIGHTIRRSDNTSSETEDGNYAYVNLSENVTARNGVYQISYDPAKTSFVRSVSNTTLSSVNADEQNGIITFAYANLEEENPIEIGETIETFVFEKPETVSQVSVTTIELNEEEEVTGEETVVELGNPYFSGHSLLLSGTIGVQFGIVLPEDVSGFSDSYVSFELGQEGRKESYTDLFDPNDRFASGKYRFTCPVSSIQMAEPITPTYHYFVDGAEKTVTGTPYSAKDFIDYALGNPSGFSSKEIDVVKALADYGHHCQPYLSSYNKWTIGVDYLEMTTYVSESFDYDTVRSEVSSYALNKPANDPVVEDVKIALRFDSENILSVIFILKGDAIIESVKVNGVPYDYTFRDDGSILVRIAGIKATQLADSYRVSVNDCEVSASALSYVYAALASETTSDALKDTVCGLYGYAAACKRYTEE